MPTSTSSSRVQRKYSMDSGYSWLVLFSSFMINLIVLGQMVAFGIYALSIRDHFRSTRKSTSMVGAISYALMCLLGPVSSVLQKRYGARVVIMSGALLSTMGMALSYFAAKLWHLYFTYGVLAGLGYGLCLTPAIAILPEYFDKYRYLCTTLATVGASVGGLIFGPLTFYLVETYLWRGAMLIHAGICLQIIVFGALCKSRVLEKEASLKSLFDLSIIKNELFVLLLLDGAVLGGTSFTLFSMINSFVISRGLSRWKSAKLVSVIGICDIVARIVAVLISNFKWLDRVVLYSIMTLTTGLSVFACVLGHRFTSFAIALGIFGFSVGVKFSQPANVIIDLFGVQHLVIGFGYFMFSVGVGGFTLPLVAGWLADRKDQKNAFILAGICCMVAFACCCILIVLRWQRKRSSSIVDNNIQMTTD